MSAKSDTLFTLICFIIVFIRPFYISPMLFRTLGFALFSCQQLIVERETSQQDSNALNAFNALIVSLFQGGETAADTAESMHTTRRLKKLQNLVQAKRGHQSGTGKGKNTSENDGELLQVMFFNLCKRLCRICCYWYEE